MICIVRYGERKKNKDNITSDFKDMESECKLMHIYDIVIVVSKASLL